MCVDIWLFVLDKVFIFFLPITMIIGSYLSCIWVSSNFSFPPIFSKSDEKFCIFSEYLDFRQKLTWYYFFLDGKWLLFELIELWSWKKLKKFGVWRWNFVKKGGGFCIISWNLRKIRLKVWIFSCLFLEKV